MTPEKPSTENQPRFLAYTKLGERHFLSPDDDIALVMTEGGIKGYRESMMKKAETKERTSGKPRVVISGSFKFKDAIDKTIDIFTEAGIDVLAPPKGQVIGQTDMNVKILEGDDSRDSADLWGNFMDAITQADSLYVYAHNGYIGPHVQMELIVAASTGIPIYSSDKVSKKIRDGRRSLTRNIKVLAPYEFTNELLEGNEEFEQYWFREPRNNVRVFPFTDHRGIRSIMFDLTDVQ